MFDDFDTQINIEELDDYYLWDDDEDWELWVIDNELDDDWN